MEVFSKLVYSENIFIWPGRAKKKKYVFSLSLVKIRIPFTILV